jgi:hypothetical protein
MQGILLTPCFGILTIGLLLSSAGYALEAPTLDRNYTIPEVQYKLGEYHFDLYLEERAKGNNTSAQEHFRLAMMQDAQRESFLDSITVFDEQQLPTISEIKIPNENLDNCILSSNSSFVCQGE